MERTTAVDRVFTLLDTIEGEIMPVPLREVWVYGELALGLDPVSRIDVYIAKDMLYTEGSTSADVGRDYEEHFGISGIGTTVRAEWAEQFPEHIRANDAGYAAPERCLAAHILEPDESIHLEICNAGFESNVTQRVHGARTRDAYEEIIDPRGVCLWMGGERSEEAPEKLRAGTYVFPPLAEALMMIGLDEEEARTAAEVLDDWRSSQEGASVRGDVI